MSDRHPHTDTDHYDPTALIVVFSGLFVAALIFVLPQALPKLWTGTWWWSETPVGCEPRLVQPLAHSPGESRKPPNSEPDKLRHVILMMGSKTVRKVLAPEPEPEVPMGEPVVVRGVPVDPRTTQFMACASDAPDLSRLRS
jgi:hypothetical protein